MRRWAVFRLPGACATLLPYNPPFFCKIIIFQVFEWSKAAQRKAQCRLN
jgi:hypothetical protein